MTSPGNNLVSSVVSPRINMSYRSSVRTSLPCRFSWILRNDPIGLTPPAEKSAAVIVPRPLIV